MPKVLKQNVVLRRPLNNSPIVFLQGETLPKEYEAKVGSHLFVEVTEAEAKKEKPKEVPREAELASTPEEEGLEVPAGNASKAIWQKFAEANGVAIPEDAGRNDIIELVKAEMPDIEV